MTPWGALQNQITHYAVFRGRASRSEYWWFTFDFFLLAGGAFAWDQTIGTTLVGVLVVLPLVVPSFAVTSRRLHDTGRTGLWAFLQLAPFGVFAVLAMACQRGDRNDNAYGPPPLRTARARVATRSTRTRTSTAAFPESPNQQHESPTADEAPLLNLFRAMTDKRH